VQKSEMMDDMGKGDGGDRPSISWESERPQSLFDEDHDTPEPEVSLRSPRFSALLIALVISIIVVGSLLGWAWLSHEAPGGGFRVADRVTAKEEAVKSDPSGLSQPTLTAPEHSVLDSETSAAESNPSTPDADAAAPSASLVAPQALADIDPLWDPLEAVERLPSAAALPRAPPYDRGAFGQEWLDVDRNGCDTRNDMLRRDLSDLVLREGTQGCVAAVGTFVDPYSGGTFEFERGAGNAGQLHVDHIVALADAWNKGASAWPREQRERFANDPENLVVTFGEVNMTKGSLDVTGWLPPADTAHCGFALQVVWVKDTYGVAVTESERRALTDLILDCDASDGSLLGD
jgi:hypothetical protein